MFLASKMGLILSVSINKLLVSRNTLKERRNIFIISINTFKECRNNAKEFKNRF